MIARYLIGVACLAVVTFVATGCAVLKEAGLASVPPYQPENVYKPNPTLDSTVIRVAVLPMTAVEGQEEDSKTLETVLHSELAKSKRFELFQVSSDVLLRHTGQRYWSAEEPLPADFLSWIQKEFGCNAVMFTKLTTYRGFPPLAVGWRMRLVDCHSKETLWAIDEIYDAGKDSVRSGAKHYASSELPRTERDTDSWAVLTSPRLFAQYAAAETAGTLPER